MAKGKTEGWKLKDILFMAISAVIFGVLYLGATYMGGVLTGVLTPSGWGILGYEPFYGIWFMEAAFVTYVVRKPGIGIVAEMLAALLEVLMGNYFGPIVFISGFVQGLGCEIAFWASHYKRYDMPTMICSALGATILSYIWTGIRQSYWTMQPSVLLVILVIRAVSAIVFCAVITKAIADGLAKAGVLKGFAIGANAGSLDVDDD